MPTDFKPATKYDAIGAMGGGVNMGDTPLDLPKNVMASAINTTVTGKNVTHRPAFANRIINQLTTPGFAAVFLSNGGYGNPQFQGCTEQVCLDDSGNAYVLALISERVFSFLISGNTVTCTELNIYKGCPIMGGETTGGIIFGPEYEVDGVITAAPSGISIGTISGTFKGAVAHNIPPPYFQSAVTISGNVSSGSNIFIGTLTNAEIGTVPFVGTCSVTATSTETVTDLSVNISYVAVQITDNIQPQAWLWQAECWVIIQDGLANPIIVNLNTQIAVRSNYGEPLKYNTTLSNSVGVAPPGGTFIQGFVSVANLSIGQTVVLFNTGIFTVINISGLNVTLQTVSGNGSTNTGGLAYWKTFGTGIPPGRMGAYGLQRNWYVLNSTTATPNGFYAGDICGGASGTPAFQYRDAVLQSTENTYIVGGGNFCIPGNAGPITAMRFLATPNVSLGQGPLLVFTHKSVFSCQAPLDRLTWQSLTNPIVTETLISNGAKGQWSTKIANSDAIFRSVDGVRSLSLASMAESNRWANKPCSFEVSPVLALDNQALLEYGSAIVFGNRWIGTVGPIQSGEGCGVYHTGLTVLNFAPITSLRGDAPAVWDSGQWIGSGLTSQMQVMQLTVGEVNQVERAFAFTLNTTTNPSTIEFWEILQDGAATTDNDGVNNILIPWQFDSASLRFGIPIQDHVYMFLSNGEMWVDKLTGLVTFQVLYKSDQYPSWTPWLSWQEQQTVDAPNSQPAFRPRMGLGEPSAKPIDFSTGRPMRNFFTLQVRNVILGHCVFMGEFFESQTTPMPVFAKMLTKPICTS